MEWFADTDRADLFASAIAAAEQLVVPVHTVYEVLKELPREAGDETAAALSLMQRGRIVNIDLGLALEAAVNGLPMADSLIYATAGHHGAVLWTQDAHFDGLPAVRYFQKGIRADAVGRGRMRLQSPAIAGMHKSRRQFHHRARRRAAAWSSLHRRPPPGPAGLKGHSPCASPTPCSPPPPC